MSNNAPTGFSPVTAFSSEQISPVTINEIMCSLEDAQTAQQVAERYELSRGNQTAAERYRKSRAEAESVKNQIKATGGRTLNTNIKEIPEMLPQWAPEPIKNALAGNKPLGQIA